MATLVLALVAWVPGPARASELELSVDSACAVSELPAEVEAALGRSLGAGAPQLRARVAMRREGGRVHVVVGLDRLGARSERTFQAPDCAHAAHAAALVVALALSADVSAPIAERPERASSAAPEAAPLVLDFETQLFLDAPEEREEGEEGEASAPAPEVPSVRASFLASALIDAGSLPGVEGGARLGVGIATPLLLFELEATYMSASRAASAQPGASVDLVLAFGTLRAGARWAPVPWLSLGGGAELDVGAMSGAGAGARLDQPSSALMPWLALRGALILEIELTRVLSLRASGSIGTPLVAPSFEVVGVGSAFSSSSVLAQGALGLVVRLS